MKKRFMSMLLVLCMVFTLFPSAAFAAETGTPIGTTSVTEGAPLCENHKTHNEDCGYIEAKDAQPCGDLLEDGSYSCAPVLGSGAVSGNTATPGDAEAKYVCDHIDDCGYAEMVESADCTHECELCKDIIADTCVCGSLCTQGLMNPDCLFCAAEGADLTKCVGAAAMMMAMPRGTVTDVSDLTALNNAISSATGDMSFRLTASMTGRVIINSITHNLTIDLNGQTLSGDSNDFVINHAGTKTLTIMDSSAGKNGKITTSGTAPTIQVQGNAVLKITGGTVENTSTGKAIYHNSTSKTVISSGSPIIKSSGGAAMSKAPDVSSYTNVKVTASKNYEGSSPEAAYDAAKINDYKYLTFGVETKMLSELVVTTQPTKTAYTAGELFDKSGMVVTANYSDGSVAVVTSYTVSPSDALATSDTKVTVSYTDGSVTKTADVNITVSAASSIITGDGYSYDPDSKTLTITNDAGTTAWRGNTSITKADVTKVVMTGVTTIGVSAFDSCTSLGSVTFEGATPPTTFGTDVFFAAASGLKIYVPKDSVQAYKTGTTSAYASKIVAVGAITEQFTLPTGETYYFDLSGELVTVTNGVSSTIGTINVGKTGSGAYPGLPDPTLHYVPFTYTGTVNAYSLESSSSGQTGSSAAATASDRSLFVAEYNVSHTKSWDGLNTASLIYGKTLDTNYKLRSMSVGSSRSTDGGINTGAPVTNEWDCILTKKSDYIKNYKNILSCGQDTVASDSTFRTVRGGGSARDYNSISSSGVTSGCGFRPALEVLNPDALTADGLKAVTLSLNGGKLKDSTADINIVCAGTTFKAPSGEGLTPPSGKAFDKWQKTGDTSTTYAAGDTITHASGLGLTALWKDASATVTAVAVTPKTANVQKGTTQQFNPAVTGTNNPAQTVTWTVTGGTKSGTTINASGLLTVAADETATSLTVKATSTVDTAKSDTAAVTVTTPVAKYALTVTGGTGGGDYEADASVTVTANTAPGGQQFKEWTATGITLTDKTQNPATFAMPARAVSLTAVYEPISAGTYTVTLDARGGSVSPTSLTVTAGNTATLPTPSRRGSYRFDGWFTEASGGTQYTSSTPINSNMTLYAHWTYTGGGGSSSGGSNIIVTPPAPDKPNTPTQAEIKVDGKTDANGNTSITVTDKNITDAIAKAEADAKKNGNTANGVTIVLSATGGKNAQSVTVNLPKTVQDLIISKKVVSTIIVVDNPDVQIGMDLKAITEINAQAKSDVNITAQRLDSGKLTGTEKTAIGSRPVFNLAVNYGSGKQVQSFGAGGVSVTIPYTLGRDEKAGNVCAVYVDGSGKVQWLTSSVYDSTAKVLRFSTNHFSTYGVGYKQDAPAFTDIANHWAKADIEYVVSRRLFSGTGNTTFSPNTAMTRGMFVTALGRLANADVSSYKTSSFSDVKADSYYMGYIEWANKNGIVNGSDGKFMPDQSITREQMAVIMQNYAKTIGFTLPKVHEEKAFADSAKISGYAKDAVKIMQMAGVISGKNGNVLDPQGTATRAEVSAVLRRFVELRISIDTAQGWTMNDSGKWMYYENGKAVTGKKDIGGISYTFDQNGEMADVPKNLKYTTHTVVKNESWRLIAHKYECSAAELARDNNKTVFDVIHPGDVLKVPQK